MTTAVATERFSKTALSPAAIAELTQELDRKSRTKRDIVVPSKDFSIFATGIDADGNQIPDNGKRIAASVALGGVVGDVAFDVGRVAHEQLGEKAGIPRPYYKRCLSEAPALLTENVNHWIHNGGEGNGKNYLVRTLDGRVRAFLSDRYRTLDDVDLCFEALKVAKEVNAVCTRADLTDERFYLRLLAPDFSERVDFPNGGGGAHTFVRAKDGDDLIPGIVVSNSEVGRGGLSVNPFIFNAACTNGAWLDTKLFQVHLGRQMDIGYLSSETLAKDDAAIWGKVHDLIKATFNKEQFADMVARFRGAAEQQLVEPVEAVDAVVKHYGLTDDDKQSILNELISPQSRENDPGRTVYGLLQAITAQAHKVENYDEASQYEKIGGDFLSRAEALVKVR